MFIKAKTEPPSTSSAEESCRGICPAHLDRTFAIVDERDTLTVGVAIFNGLELSFFDGITINFHPGGLAIASCGVDSEGESGWSVSPDSS